MEQVDGRAIKPGISTAAATEPAFLKYPPTSPPAGREKSVAISSPTLPGTAGVLPIVSFSPGVVEAERGPETKAPAAQELIYFPKSQFSPRFGDTFFTCSVTAWSYNRDPTVCSFEALFVRYEVELRMGRRTWTLQRRFSEFVQLHSLVVGKFGFLPPPHPPRSCYRVLYDRAFLNDRQAALAAYLDGLLRALSSNHCMGDGQIREFFSFPAQ